MTIEELLKLAAAPSVTVICVIVWFELRAIRKSIHGANNKMQKLLVMALTGELKSYSQWESENKTEKEA